jgi:integrase/recombinase XerD
MHRVTLSCTDQQGFQMTAGFCARQNPPAEVSRKSLRLSSCLDYVSIRQKEFLFTAKTGTAVYCLLPPFLLTALEAVPTASDYFFWTGTSKPKSAVGDWQRALKRLFAIAGAPGGHAHRFRDTFAVELLLASVPMERVSVLMGHQSVRITEKFYAPWVRARQEQLEADVRRTWTEVPDEARGTQEVREPARLVN